MAKIEIDEKLIDTAAHIGGLVSVGLHTAHPELAKLPSAIREGLVIQGVLAHLIGHGFLAGGPSLQEAEDGWIALDLTPEATAYFQKRIDAAIKDAVDRQERIEAALPRRGQRSVTLADEVTERPR